jgi:hypothetical protein
MVVRESDLAGVLRSWTDQLAGPPDRLGAVDRRIRRHRNRVRTAGAAAVCAVIAVGALVAGHTTTAHDQGPAVRRGPSHPAIVFPDVYSGATVSGQVSGVGVQSRSTLVTWPEAARMWLALQCAADVGTMRISAGSATLLTTSCVGPGVELFDESASGFDIPAGSLVTLTVATDAQVTGPWAVAVLNRDPRWAARRLLEPTFQGRTLQHWVSADSSATVSVRLTAADADPVFVLTCGQPGRLSLVLNNRDVGTVSCADATWSQQVLPVSRQSLVAAGYLPGRTATIAVAWEGQPWWPRVAVAQYGG